MKALKTVVATAVIVFALTTVAAAGVRHLGDRDGDTQHPPYAQTAAQPGGSVTLSAEQFAALLRAAGDDINDRAMHATRTHEKAQERSRTHASEADHILAGAQHSGGQRQGSGGETHHAETGTADDGGSRDGGSHDGHSLEGGTHEGGPHQGGSHEGGCD